MSITFPATLPSDLTGSKGGRNLDFRVTPGFKSQLCPLLAMTLGKTLYLFEPLFLHL